MKNNFVMGAAIGVLLLVTPAFPAIIHFDNPQVAKRSSAFNNAKTNGIASGTVEMASGNFDAGTADNSDRLDSADRLAVASSADANVDGLVVTGGGAQIVAELDGKGRVRTSSTVRGPLSLTSSSQLALDFEGSVTKAAPMWFPITTATAGNNFSRSRPVRTELAAVPEASTWLAGALGALLLIGTTVQRLRTSKKRSPFGMFTHSQRG